MADAQTIQVSQMLDERKRSIMLTLAGGPFDRTKDYFLVARDAKTKAEAWHVNPSRITMPRFFRGRNPL